MGVLSQGQSGLQWGAVLENQAYLPGADTGHIQTADTVECVILLVFQGHGTRERASFSWFFTFLICFFCPLS